MKDSSQNQYQEISSKSPPPESGQESFIASPKICKKQEPTSERWDTSYLDLEQDNLIAKIDYKKMKESVKSKSILKPDGKSYTFKDVCCNFKPGSHYLFSSSQNSELNRFGIGISLYFKLVKHLSFYFFIFSLLSIPALIFYVSAYHQYSENADDMGYLDALTSTGLGSVGLGSTSCGIAVFPTYASSNEDKQIDFYCTEGVIADVSNIVFGIINTADQCEFVADEDISTACNLYTTTDLIADFAGCSGQPDCTFTLSTNMFVPEASSPSCSEAYSEKAIYMRVACISDTIDISDTKSISRTAIAYFVTTMDAVIILLFLFMIFSLKFVQKSATKFALKETYSASLYSLRISNLPPGTIAEEMTAELWNLMNEKLHEKGQVLDVQIAPNEKVVRNTRLIDFISKKKNDSIKKFVSLYAPTQVEQIKRIRLQELQNMLNTLKEQNYPNLKKAEKSLKKIQDLANKKKTLREENQKLMNDPTIPLNDAFVTFDTVQARNKIFELYQTQQQPHKIATRSSKAQVHPMPTTEANLIVNPVDEPTSIIWENVGQEPSKVFKRRAISFLITFTLWVISAVIIIALTFEKNTVNNKYPAINCKNEDPTKQEAADDYAYGIYQQGLIVCYCSKHLTQRLHEVFPTADNKELCAIWLDDQITAQAVTWGIVIIVILINLIMQIVIQLLSTFERHVSSNEKLAHKVVKIFLGQFFNTGMIILLVNINSSISWWQGNFDDIGPTWYDQVGSTIISTMLINAVSTPTAKIAGFIIKKVLQFIDRKFGKDDSITKKKRQADYEALYTLPEFVIDARYGQILTIIFITFLYGSGMPLLYLTSFLQFIYTYFSDKFYFLKCSKRPKYYDQKVESIVQYTLHAAVIMHLIFAIFLYGEGSLFELGHTTVSTSETTVSSIPKHLEQNTESPIKQFIRRAGFKFNLILTITLISLTIYYLVKIGLYFSKKLKKNQPVEIEEDLGKTSELEKSNSTNTDPKLTLPLYKVLKLEDLGELIQSTKQTIKQTKNINHQKLLSQKLNVLEQEQSRRLQDESTTKENQQFNFVGFYSYDFKLAPTELEH